MLLYRVSHGASETFPFVAFGGYVLAFLCTLGLVFVMPPLGIVIFFTSLATLPLVWLLAKALAATETSIALRVLDDGRCPRCDHRMQTHRDPETAWTCEFCETTFLATGRVRSDQVMDTVLPDPERPVPASDVAGDEDAIGPDAGRE